MANPFDLNHQNQHLESKIIVALERVSEAFRVLLWQRGQALKLSPIQIQILIFCKFHTAEKCKVGYLAQEFNVDKSTISDSVKTLEQKQLIEKITAPEDGRSYTIYLTKEGAALALEVASFALPFEKPIEQLSEIQKEVLLLSLLELIHKLQQVGIISLQRMCLVCQHHHKDEQGHFCTLLGMRLNTADLRVDCPDFLGT